VIKWTLMRSITLVFLSFLIWNVSPKERENGRINNSFLFLILNKFNKNKKRMWSVIRSLMKAMASQCPSEDDRFHPFLVLAWKPMRLWAHTRKEKTLRQRSPLQRLTILSLGVFY
jgi:hypothetical protein